ncbi:MAG: RodZ domain-containing protein [Terriglobales bacterium]
MPSFGEKLKQEREKRNITLEQISASTKIGTRMLQALEEDKFNQLPGGIFNKGFVRAYSRCVGLDEDQIVADYLQASGDGLRTEPAVRDNDAPGVQEKSRNKEQARIHDRVRDRIQEKVGEKDERAVLRLESSAETPSRQLPWGLFAAILLLVALTLALWNRRHEEHERKSPNPASNTSASQSSTSAVAPVAPTAGMAQEKAAASTFSGSPAAGRTASAASKTEQVSQQLSAASGEFTVIVQAREDCWVSITADGKTLSSELLAAGAERTIRGRKEIVVKAGNAGGVDFQFNGKKVDLQADYGEVRTVTFGPGGMSRNAPSPAPQP